MTFSFYDSQSESKSPRKRQPAPDWRGELKERVDQHIRSKGSTPEREKPVVGKGAKEAEQKPPETTVPPVAGPFRYRIDPKPQSTGVKPVRRSISKDRQQALEKPLIRGRSRGSRRVVDPAQRSLHLEAAPAKEPQAPPAPSAAQPEDVGKEILLTRTLCGIIDLLIPFLTGLAFAVAASWILQVDFFLANSLEWAVAFGVCFFIFNSLFFLILSGQTPGMYATDLRLVNEQGGEEQVSGKTILLRVLLFVPCALSLVGLIWSLFDQRHRTIHDIWSHTRVEATSDL